MLFEEAHIQQKAESSKRRVSLKTDFIKRISIQEQGSHHQCMFQLTKIGSELSTYFSEACDSPQAYTTEILIVCRQCPRWGKGRKF